MSKFYGEICFRGMIAFGDAEADSKEEVLEKILDKTCVGIEISEASIIDFEYEFVTSPRQGNIGSWYDHSPNIKKQEE